MNEWSRSGSDKESGGRKNPDPAGGQQVAGTGQTAGHGMVPTGTEYGKTLHEVPSCEHDYHCQ